MTTRLPESGPSVGPPSSRPKAFYEIAVVFEVEVLHDGSGDDLSDAVDPCKLFDLDAAHKVLSTETCRDKGGRNRPYVPDAEGVEDEGERLLLTPLDGSDQILRALLPEAFEWDELFGLEVVDVGSVTYESEVEQPGGKLLAQAVDIHSGLRGPVDDVLQSLRG